MSFFSKRVASADPIEFGDFNPGNIDPTTGKEIIYIAYQTSKFIVTIDTDINLNWYADEGFTYAPDFGEVASQVSLTEALVDRIFVGKKNKIAYKKILGDVLARVLDEGDSKTAKAIMQEVIKRVTEHSRERVRIAYMSYAVFSVVGVGVGVILALIFKTYLHQAISQTDIFRIIICTLLGGVGAFITTFSRFQNYQGSIMAGLPIHRLDGFLRVFYGLIAGILVSLAIKGNILAGFADGQQPWILYFFAMVAGASEILIPNLINQAEHQIGSATPPPPQTLVVAATDTAAKTGVVIEKTNGQLQKQESTTPLKIDDAIQKKDDTKKDEVKKDDIPTSTTIIVTSQENPSLNKEEKKEES
jgi:hypothetical protein